MKLRIAFVGFRHGHVFALYRFVEARPDLEIVAVCEEDAETAATLEQLGIKVTHRAYGDMLDAVESDIVACGDYFGIRGARTIAAMERRRHVLSDKPLCTSLGELEHIARLSRENSLRVGCMLDLGNLGPFITARDLIRSGRIGDVHAITFWGQHPLLYGRRPMWNFEDGKHGGTLNDIAIHAIDIIPWLTGRRVTAITAARGWNARLPQHPQFQDGAAIMLKLDNAGVAMGDVSYLSSDRHGFHMPAYWRFTISGANGVLETSCNAKTVDLYPHDNEETVKIPVAENREGGFLDDFVADLAGDPDLDNLHTARILESTRVALLAQHAADTEDFPKRLDSA